MPTDNSPSGEDWATPSTPAGAGGFGSASPGTGWGAVPAAGGSSVAPSPSGGWPSAGPSSAGGSAASWGAPTTGGADRAFAGGSTSGTSGSGRLGTATPEARGGSPSAVEGPPIWILVIGLLLPVAAIPLLLLDGLALHILGWVIAIVGSIGALAAFTAVDLRRRSSRWYVDHPGLLAGLRVAVLVTGLVVAGLFSYEIADAVARWELWF